MAKFKGYDYGELLKHFDLPIREDGERGDEVNEEALAQFLSEHNAYSEPKPKVVRAVRDFTNALIEQMEKLKFIQDISIWKGLAKIKDDSIFIAYFIALIPHAWT